MKTYYMAKPSVSNWSGSRMFETLPEARNFLEKITEYQMKIVDWIMIGKILKVDIMGNEYEITEEEIKN